MQIVIFTGSSWIESDSINDPDKKIYPILRAIGPYQVANVLRNSGYTVKIIDYFPYIFHNFYEDLLEISKKYISKETLWVGFSTTFFSTFAGPSGTNQKVEKNSNPLLNKKIYDFKRELLNLNKNLKIVIGGAVAWKKDYDDFADFYVEGYADSSAIELTKFIEGKNVFFQYQGKSVTSDRTAINFNFSEHSFQWHETDFVKQNEVLPIEISRGCIFKCSYCSFPLNGKKKLDFIKSPKILLDEFKRNYELYGITSYQYADDTHNDSLDKLRFLYDEVYSKLPFKIKFSTFLRLDLIRAHRDMIPLLRESGLSACFFGIESLNYESNKVVGKGMRMEHTLEILSEVRKEWPNIHMQAGFIVGLPNESESSAQKWLEIIREPDFPLDRITLNSLCISRHDNRTGYWLNEIEKNVEKYGYTFTSDTDWINNKGLTKKRAGELVYQTYNYIYKTRNTHFTWMTDWRLQNLNLTREKYMSPNFVSNKVHEFIYEYVNLNKN